MELLLTRPGFAEAQQEGMVSLTLDPLVDRRLFESLIEGSRSSYAARIDHRVMFTEVPGLRPERRLGVTARDAARQAMAQICIYIHILYIDDLKSSRCQRLQN